MKEDNYFPSPIFNGTFYVPIALIIIQILAAFVFLGYWSEKITDTLLTNPTGDRVIEFVKKYILIYHYFLIYLFSALDLVGILSVFLVEYLVENCNYPDGMIDFYYRHMGKEAGIDFDWRNG